LHPARDPALPPDMDCSIATERKVMRQPLPIQRAYTSQVQLKSPKPLQSKDNAFPANRVARAGVGTSAQAYQPAALHILLNQLGRIAVCRQPGAGNGDPFRDLTGQLVQFYVFL